MRALYGAGTREGGAASPAPASAAPEGERKGEQAQAQAQAQAASPALLHILDKTSYCDLNAPDPGPIVAWRLVRAGLVPYVLAGAAALAAALVAVAVARVRRGAAAA
jgi:hypothetical protein